MTASEPDANAAVGGDRRAEDLGTTIGERDRQSGVRDALRVEKSSEQRVSLVEQIVDEGEDLHVLGDLVRPKEPPSASASNPWEVKPFFIWRLTAPPSALRPNTGLLDQTSARWIALGGMRSQLTVSPNASLTRIPFM